MNDSPLSQSTRDSEETSPLNGRQQAISWLLLFVVLGMSVAAPISFSQEQPAAADSIDFDAEKTATQGEYFQGLRDRQLFELIELLCQRKLSHPGLSVSEQVFYRIELARTFALHAQTIPLNEAEELWTQAEQALQPVRGFEAVLELERALLVVARSRQQFQILQADAANEPVRQNVLRLSDQALKQLQPVEVALAKSLSAPSSAATVADPRLSEERLDEVRVGLAEVHIQLAVAQIHNVPERTFHLQEARKHLALLTRRTLSGRWEWEATLKLARVARLEKKQQELTSLVKALSSPSLPLTVRQRAVAEEAEFLLSENKATAAAELVLEHGKEWGGLPPFLEAIRLQALLQMSERVSQAGDARLAEELSTEVDQRLMRMEEQGESYYAWKVRRYQQELTLRQEYGPELALQVEQARRAIQSGNQEQAGEAYARALLRAVSENRLKVAQELGRELAQVDFQQAKYAHAAEHLKTVWQSSPLLEEMERSHLLWVQALGRDYISGPTQEKLSVYLSGLQDHRQRYADRATFGEATFLLAELQFARMQVTRALALYQEVPEKDSRFEQALIRQAECYRWILQRVRDLKQPVTAWEMQTVDFARQVLQRMAERPSITPTGAEAVLISCRLLLDLGAEPVESLRQQISRVLEATNHQIAQAENAAPAEAALSQREFQQWRRVLQSGIALQGILLAAGGQVTEARELLLEKKSAEQTPEEMLFLARQLAEVTSDSSELQYALAELRLDLTAPLLQEGTAETTGMSPQQFRELRQLRGEAYAQIGRLSRAIPLFEGLVKEQPGDRRLVERLAQLYVDCQNAECAEKLYQLRQAQVRREKQGTESWLEARYQLALIAYQTKRQDEAKKIVQMTRLLYPHVGSDDLQQRYQKLAQEWQLR